MQKKTNRNSQCVIRLHESKTFLTVGIYTCQLGPTCEVFGNVVKLIRP